MSFVKNECQQLTLEDSMFPLPPMNVVCSKNPEQNRLLKKYSP